MTKSSSKPVVPGQEICIFMDGSYDDSMSSLESFMSFMDDSEEDHQQVQAKAKHPTKKRSKPRRTQLIHQRTAPTTTPSSPPTRTNSNPEFAVSPRPPSSRWDTMGRSKSCQSSPGRPRSTRRLSPIRPRPVITVDRNHTKDSNTHNKNKNSINKEGGTTMDTSSHSVNSLELKMLGVGGAGAAADRWSADASSSHVASHATPTSGHTSSLHNSLGTTSFGGNSSGRWQDSYAGGNESGHDSSCLSRWSTSISSSQMEQISTRPRFPRRKRSGLKGIIANANATATAAPANNRNNTTAGSLEAWNNSFIAMTATTFPSTAGDFTDSYSTNKATTGSDIEELSFVDWEEGSHRCIVDCNLLLQPTSSNQGTSSAPPSPAKPAPETPGTPPTAAGLKTMSSPTPALPVVAMKSVTKPRPQLPHRQKSFGRGMSIGMAAKAVMERRERFVKQRSEPSIVSGPPDRSPSDLSVSYSSHLSSTGEQKHNLSGAGVHNVRRNSFRRQQSVPQSLLTHSQATDAVAGTSRSPERQRENPAKTGPLAALRKQKSLSSLAMDIPQMPERQASQSSSMTLSNHSTTTGGTAAARKFCKQRSLSSLGVEDCTARRVSDSSAGSKRVAQRRDSPQLPQRLPSESSSRALCSADDNDDDNDQEKDGGTNDPAPSMPQRQISMDSLTTATAAARVTAATREKATNQAPALALTELHENQIGNRRLSLTKQMSEPNALSLKKLIMFGEDPLNQKLEDLMMERPNKRQALFLASSGLVVGNSGSLQVKEGNGDTTSRVLAACHHLLSSTTSSSMIVNDDWRPRSSPELGCGLAKQVE